MRTAGRDELASALTPIWHYFGMPGGPDEDRVARVPVPDGRMLVALDGGTVVGGAGVFPLELTVPGGPVRTAGMPLASAIAREPAS